MIRTGWRIYGFTGRSRGERVPVRRDRRQRGRGSRRHRRSAVAPGAGASRAGPGPEARVRQMSHDEYNGIQVEAGKRHIHIAVTSSTGRYEWVSKCTYIAG